MHCMQDVHREALCTLRLNFQGVWGTRAEGLGDKASGLACVPPDEDVVPGAWRLGDRKSPPGGMFDHHGFSPPSIAAKPRPFVPRHNPDMTPIEARSNPVGRYRPTGLSSSISLSFLPTPSPPPSDRWPHAHKGSVLAWLLHFPVFPLVHTSLGAHTRSKIAPSMVPDAESPG